MAIVETLEVRLEANMGQFAAQLSSAAVKLESLSAALTAGKASLALQGAGLVQAVAEAIRGAAYASAAPMEAGSALVNKLVQAILSGTGRSASAAQNVAAAANFADAGAISAAYSAGANLSQGFANGILSRMGAVMAAANRVANAASARIQSALKIHSPSKVARELGGWFGEGFAGGIYDTVELAKSSAEALGAGAVGAVSAHAANPAGEIDPGGGLSGMVRSAVSDALGGTSFVIPLNVDGVKLGEASIRGINRVTRSAGRLMLEI